MLFALGAHLGGKADLSQAWLRQCPVLASGPQSLLTGMADQHVADAGRLISGALDFESLAPNADCGVAVEHREGTAMV